MRNIAELGNADNFVASVECSGNVRIIVEKWNGEECCIEGTECCCMQLNSCIKVEIGEIRIKEGKDFDDPFEKAFAMENKAYSEYEELIIYYAWETDRVNFRAIAKNFILTDEV